MKWSGRQKLPGRLPRINHKPSVSGLGDRHYPVGVTRHAHLRAEWSRACQRAGFRAPRRRRHFQLSDGEAPRNAAATSSLRSISTLDALMALQGVEDPTERKKRAVAKGRKRTRRAR